MRCLKKTEKIEAKTDTYVLESNVHFPTDINLLWDASRKCIHILSQLHQAKQIPGWRKKTDWAQKLKGLMRTCSQINRSGGKNKEERLRAAVTNYLDKAYELEAKVNQSINRLYQCSLGLLDLAKMLQVEYFHEMLIKHIDLIDRRLLKKEIIPHEEKNVFTF